MKEALSHHDGADSSPAREPFTEEEIHEYADGCQLLGENLSTVVENIIEQGKRPTILIPSRGAVPIFLLALEYLRQTNGDNRLVDPEKTEYYPGGIFPYLSEGKIKEHRMNGASGSSTEADVVLYPFTADVMSTNTHRDGRVLSRTLRQSCARATVDLLYGEKKSLDLQWNAFLLSKINNILFDDFHSSPQNLVKTLHTVEPDKDRQIILIDTVISGRASTDIAEAFVDLGHPVVPILAVDTSRGVSRYQREYQERTQRATLEVISFFDQGRPDLHVHEFPLISEDKGAALLGVSAVNFRDFNHPEVFHKIDDRFGEQFVPQSCLWTIPPRGYHVPLFHAFIERCSADINGNGTNGHEAWQQHADGIRQTIRSRIPDYMKHMKGLIKSSGLVSATDSSSHIISVGLEPRDTDTWIREFSRTAFDA